MNKIADEYNNNYHHSIGRELIGADYSLLTEEIESIHIAPKFKIGDKVRIIKYKNIVSKGYTKNWSKEIFLINSVLKTLGCINI